MIRAGLLLSAALLGGCLATTRQAPTAAGEWAAFAPAQWNCRFQVVKQLSTERDGQRREITALAQVDAERVRLVAVSPVGVTLFELLQAADGSLELRNRLPLPEGFDPRWVLRDFQQLHAPAAVLRESQEPGWQLQQDDARGRRILRDGQASVSIRYGEGGSRGQINHLVNHEFGYTLSARTLDFTAPDTPGCARVIR